MVKTYTRRSAEERIAEHQMKIEEIKQREASKEIQQSAEGKAAVAAARAISKALEVAKEAKDGITFRGCRT